MLILTIVLGVIIICLVMFLVFIKKEVKNINEQLEYINSHDTNKIIQTAYNNKELVALCSNIDALLKECKKTTLKEKEINDRLKGDITNLSHDIRTPLTSLKGYFELMNQTCDLNQKKHYEKIIEDRLDSLENLLEQLFTYAKLQNNAYNFELGKVNVSEQLKKSIFSFYDVLKQYGIEPYIDIPEDDIYVVSNKDVLNRIFQNIIKNAIAYGDSTFDVCVSASHDNVKLSFSNGCKSTNDIDIDRVFDRFYRAEKARTGTATGLGLYIVKELVEQTNGNVKAYIENGKFVLDINIKID